MRKFPISEETINAIMSYLGTQPYQQVKPLFDRVTAELQAASAPQPVPAPEKASKPEAKKA